MADSDQRAKALNDLHSANESDSGTPVTAFLDKESVPEPGKQPERYGAPVNLAKPKAGGKLLEVCGRFATWAASNIRRFEGQSQREKFTENGGIMDIADRMTRVALNQDTSNTQTRNTLSDVTSPMFLIQERTITAGEMAIFFADPAFLPAEYVPEVNTSEYTYDDGKRIAEHQNALQQFTFDEDHRKEKIRELTHWTNVYGNQVVKHGWVHEEREVKENVPDEAAGVNENGTFKKFKRQTSKRVTKDWPTIERWPIENVFADSNIPNAQDQICIGYKTKMLYGDLLKLYLDGQIENIDKITPSHKYMGEREQQQPEDKRRENAGEAGHTEQTGEIEVWEIWGRVPIHQSETKTRKTVKASWDESKHAPIIYQAIYAGNIHQNPVCLKLCMNPYWHGEIPIQFIHSHQDDKGLYHKGDAEMIQSLYYQATTNINQAIDNVTKRNSAPLIANGPIQTRDLTYKQNKVIRTDRTTELREMRVEDTTRITLEMQRFIENEANKLTGADKPIRAEALGSRTSATEASNVHEQAQQPLDERAAYFADQLFHWMYRLDAHNWRQFGDPNTRLSITHNDMVFDVSPGELWGPVRTKIIAVDRFSNDVTRRQQRNAFMQNVLPLFLSVIPPSGQKVLGRQLFHDFDIRKLEEVFPMGADIDAEARAKQAADAILFGGGFVEPQNGENHAAWIPVLEHAAQQYKLLPEGEFESARHQALLFHIQQRRQMQAAEAAQVQNAGAQAGQSEPQQGLAGEIGANAVEAAFGATANLA